MPSSLRKIESARANGAKSKGPTTDHGRQAVTLNAVKHGLSAKTVILQNESPEEYQAELQDYLDHFRPQGPSELHLVHQVAAAGWRLARYAGVESALLDHKMDEQAKFVDEEYPGVPEKRRLAIAFNALASSSPSLALVNRYQARLHHEYQRNLKSLIQLQTARRAAEAKLQNEPNPTSEQAFPTGLLSLPSPALVPSTPSPTFVPCVSEPRPKEAVLNPTHSPPPNPAQPPTPIYSNKRGPDVASP